MTDFELITSILSGDKSKYAILVEKYQPMVFRICRGFVDYKEDADDLSQDVFIKAYFALNSFNSKAAFSTWLYRITVNTCINHKHKANRASFIQSIQRLNNKSWFKSEMSNSDRIPLPDQAIIDQQQALHVKQAIGKLPEKQQTALILSKYEEIPQHEIAKIMETSVGAVEQLLLRAKDNLRKNLKDYYLQNFSKP